MLYLLTYGEYSDYGISELVETDSLTADDLKRYQAEWRVLYDKVHDKELIRVAEELGVAKQSSSYQYHQMVGWDEYSKALDKIGHDETDYRAQVLKGHGIRYVEYEEYNLDYLD